ncbi:unnamed protein product [Arctogadus glacialis]
MEGTKPAPESTAEERQEEGQESRDEVFSDKATQPHTGSWRACLCSSTRGSVCTRFGFEVDPAKGSGD